VFVVLTTKNVQILALLGATSSKTSFVLSFVFSVTEHIIEKARTFVNKREILVFSKQHVYRQYINLKYFRTF
jgi:hypothetical protein